MTTHHPRRFPEAWKDGCTYIAAVNGHVATIIDGKTHDWSCDRALRITELYRIHDERTSK